MDEEKLKVRIQTNGAGLGSIQVGEVDLSRHVSAIDVKIRAAQTTEVVLHLSAHALEVDIDGMEWSDLLPILDGKA